MAPQTVVVTVTMPPPTPVVVEIVAAKPGEDGIGAYQSYLDTTTDDPPLTEAEWSASRAVAALPLAGGAMDEGAAITFANGTRIITGRMAAAPTVTDDVTKGFIVGSVVETDAFDRYVCMDTTEGAAVWTLQVINAYSAQHADDSSTVWNGYDAYVNLGNYVPYSGALGNVDLGTFAFVAYDGSSSYTYFDYAGINRGGVRLVDVWGKQLKDSSVSNAVSVDWEIRRLYGADGVTAVMDWNNNSSDHAIYGVSSEGSRKNAIDLINGGLVDDTSSAVEWVNHKLVTTGQISGTTYGTALNWATRQLIAPDGVTPIAGWDASGFGFGFDGMNNFYFTLAQDGIMRTGALVLDFVSLELQDTTNVASVAWGTRQLLAADGSTVMLDWSNPSGILRTNRDFEALSVNVANGYTSMGGPAIFPQGIVVVYGHDASFDANNLINIGSLSAVMGSPCALPAGGGNLLTDATGVLASDCSYDILTNPYAVLRADNGYIQMGTLYANDLSCLHFSSAEAIKLIPLAVTALSAYSNEGTTACVNDADTPVIGSAVVGGGAAKCLVCHNGTSWIVTALL